MSSAVIRTREQLPYGTGSRGPISSRDKSEQDQVQEMLLYDEVMFY